LPASRCSSIYPLADGVRVAGYFLLRIFDQLGNVRVFLETVSHPTGVQGKAPVPKLPLHRRGWYMGYWRDGNTGYDNGLRDIASKTDRKERIQKLADWAKLLWREAEEAGCVVALWHPEILLDEVKAAWSPVYEIIARTPEEAEQQLPEPWKTFLAEYIPPNQPPPQLAPSNATQEFISELQKKMKK